MSSLYIQAHRKADQLCFDLQSVISLFVYQVAKSDQVRLFIKILQTPSSENIVALDLTQIKYELIESPPENSQLCVWPIILTNKTIIAGLCSVVRQLIKSSSNNKRRELLGFREACLLACSESSIWTRFCEIDIIETINELLRNSDEGDTFILPKNVLRFEYHLGQPVRIHNVYKLARLKNNNKTIKSSVPIEELNLNHTYGEGPFMTLSDIILYPCFHIFFTKLPEALVTSKLPRIAAWYSRMQTNSDLPKFNLRGLECKNNITSLHEMHFVKESLYTADPKRYKPEKRIYTKQRDIDRSLCIIDALKDRIHNELTPYGNEVDFDWSSIAIDANPTCGALPEKRADRKCEQLENLAKAVIKLAGNGRLKIVDFCSGSGHLGILLAHLLSNCEVYLVENKERSLERAKETIRKLNLDNVTIIQSNLDYFVGKFDIGVSLHACGVATDLVMENCIKNAAHFVSCPCCYGGIRNCHHITYPRSQEFKHLELELSFFNLAHAADQTHDSDNSKTSQGYKCMDIIDTDRKLYAESCGYQVFLGKLLPVQCSNKNNLLVGICRNK